MIAALLAALIATPQPTPSATPLKTIVHLKSTPLCSALGRNIFHAIEGLRINDGMVTQSRLMFVKMRNDSAAAGGAMAMDNMNLQRLGSDIAHNLEGIYALLNDPAHFPKEAKTDDDHKLLAMKAQLQAVADEQQRTLNVIYGVADTYSMQEMNQRGGGMLGATGNTMKHGIYGEANPNGQLHEIRFERRPDRRPAAAASRDLFRKQPLQSVLLRHPRGRSPNRKTRNARRPDDRRDDEFV